MNNKINAKTTDWISDPQFIESSERLAGSLMSSFPLNHNVIATKKKIREVLTGQFGIKLTDADMKASERLFDIISSGRTRLNSLSTPWVAYLWENVAFSNELMEETDIPDCSDIADFYEIDSRVISLIKHAINARSPIVLMIDDFLQHMSFGIIKKILEKEGIYCLIASKVNSSDAGVYAMQAIQAMHLGGIVLFQESEPARMDEFINMAQIFGFRFGTLKTLEDAIKLDNDEEASDSTDIPEIEYVPIVKLKPHHISGEAFPQDSHNIKGECSNALLFQDSDKRDCR